MSQITELNSDSKNLSAKLPGSAFTRDQENGKCVMHKTFYFFFKFTFFPYLKNANELMKTNSNFNKRFALFALRVVPTTVFQVNVLPLIEL